MNFWSLFSRQNLDSPSDVNRLQKSVRELFPTLTENEQIKMACLAGLLARIANVDLVIEESEKDFLEKAILTHFPTVSELEAKKLASLAINEIKELCGVDNHKYCYPLNDFLSNDEKYNLILTLFALAASDGEVTNQESDEIRLINTGLLLEHKHFIAARASVMEKLKALK